MEKLLEFTTNNGNSFYVEIIGPQKNESIRGTLEDEVTRGIIQNATKNFEKALEPIQGISMSIMNSFKDMSFRPDEIEVELGLKLSAQAGLILTRLDSEAILKIVLKWKKQI